MLYKIKIIFYSLYEALVKGELGEFIHSRVFWKRVAIPVEMDLIALPAKITYNQDTSYSFVELTLASLQSNTIEFSITSRRLKAFQNLEKGFRCIAIIKNDTVIGDIWFITFIHGQRHYPHPDLQMLGIQSRDNEAYGFDMYIDSNYRGKNLAVPLQRYLQYVLKNEGFQKVYGYYWNDNLPAMWMHRIIKFHELPKRQVSHIFLYRREGFLAKKEQSV